MVLDRIVLSYFCNVSIEKGELGIEIKCLGKTDRKGGVPFHQSAFSSKRLFIKWLVH